MLYCAHTQKLYFLAAFLFCGVSLQVQNAVAELDNIAPVLTNNQRNLLGLLLRPICNAGVTGGTNSAIPSLSASPLYRMSNNHVYYFAPATTKATWAQARDFCRQHGMHLVNIDNAIENQLVFDQAFRLGTIFPGDEGNQPINAWIGIKDMNGSNNWRWASTNSLPTYLAFNAPLVAGTCGAYRGAATVIASSWTTPPCSNTQPFICEMEPLPCGILVNAINA